MTYYLDIPDKWKTATKYIGKSYCNIFDPTGKNPPDGLTLYGKYLVLYKNKNGKYEYIHTPDSNDRYVVSHCYFDNTGVDPKLADEAISVIWGGKARIQNCYFKNWGKAILIGNNDEPLDIAKDIYVEIENCVFDGCGRRTPYIQGATVHMKNCIIKNWGKTFFDKSFGVRVDREGLLTIENCVFIQDKFIQTDMFNFIKDCFGQVTDKSKILNVFKPGVTRGLYTENGGRISYINSVYKNKWWISIANTDYDENPMNKYEVPDFIDLILSRVPLTTDHATLFHEKYGNIDYL